ncbi:MAG: hypothetical protein ACI4UN_09830 [Muribaculaceae bacterium]
MLSKRSMALIVAAIGVIASCMKIEAVLSASGTWAAQTVTGTQTINLTGNVTLTGQITVAGDLTINANGADRKIINNSTTSGNTWPDGTLKTCMFYVKPGASLTINGGDYWIDIDGQANNDWANGVAAGHHLSSSGKFRMGDEGGTYRPLVYGGIYSSGTLTLIKCKVHDVNTKTIIADSYDRYNNLRGYGAITICSFDIGKYSGTAGATETNITNCEIFENVNYYGAALMTRSCSTNTINIANTKIYHNVVRTIPADAFPTGTAANEWNGVIRTEGGSNAEMTLEDVEIYENYANGECSGIFFNAKQLTMKHCKVHDNETERMGGGMRLETTFTFAYSDKGPTEVYNNKSQTYGAGIHIFSYAGGDYKDKMDFVYDINANLKVYGNETKASEYADGAGICFDFRSGTTLATGSTMTANINGAEIWNNTAAGHGGGIYAWNTTTAGKYTINVNLNKGEIKNNKANNGGGIYVKDLAITSTEGGTLKFSGNTANKSGGAVYVENGSLNLKSISIEGNVATTMNGGGIYMKGTGSTATIESGFIKGNKAPGTTDNDGGNGGGMYLRDGSMTMLNGTITGNEAKNGGGICLNVGGKLTYKNGLIYRNRAYISGGAKPATANQQLAGALNGIGGGIYLGNNSQMSFDMGTGTKIGIYDNYAEWGADDIFANGNGTVLQLPDVTTMDLSGTDAPVTKNTLLWMEDYITDDTDYNQGTYIMGSAWSGKNKRYRDLIKTINKQYYPVPGGATYSGKYMSLALGYQYIFVTLRKMGVPATVKDNFMFDIYKGDTKYMTVLLRPDNYNAETGAWERTVALPDGEWTVKESPWSWAYKNKTGPLTQDIRKNWIFTFENELQTPTPHLKNEAVKVNKIDPKGGS